MNIYAVYITDVWQTKTSYVNFGFYSSIDLANKAILENELPSEDTKVVIEEIELDKDEEDTGYEIACYEYEEREDEDED